MRAESIKTVNIIGLTKTWRLLIYPFKLTLKIIFFAGFLILKVPLLGLFLNFKFRKGLIAKNITTSPILIRVLTTKFARARIMFIIKPGRGPVSTRRRRV